MLIALRKGMTRRVLALPLIALKFARGPTGRRCNRFEADLYARTTARRREMLCPVLWCSSRGLILVARAATTLTEAEKEHLIANDGFPDWDYVPPDEGHPFEFKASDWGWLDSKLVAVDYSAPALFED